MQNRLRHNVILQKSGMFENEDFNLDESWFTEHLPEEVSVASNPQDVGENTRKSSSDISKDVNLHQNKYENSTIEAGSPKKVALKRKFPGPAGLFPEDDFTKLEGHDDSIHSNPFILSTQFLCSQNTNLTFQEPTWIDMCKDFKTGNIKCLIDKYNIDWIRNNIAHNLVNKKVPVLVGIIKQVKNTTKSPIFVIADSTGELETLISPELYEEFSEFLNVNSVLILKKFSILSINKHKHYVNITNENLVRIYSCKEATEDIKIVHIQTISNEKLEEELKSFISRYEQEKYHDNKFKCDFNKIHNSDFNKFGSNPVLNNVTNINCFKLNYPDHRSRNMISKSNSFPKIGNCLAEVKQNYIVPDNNGLLNRVYQQAKSLSECPSTSTNIFDESTNAIDLCLNIEDFQEELPLSEFDNEGNSDCSKFKNVPNYMIIDPKKRKIDAEICKSKIELDPNFNKSKNENVSNKSLREVTSDNLSAVSLKSEKNVISCTQISILTEASENSDIIKEIFCDLDAAALFDEEF